jgi:hypothetical protein
MFLCIYITVIFAFKSLTICLFLVASDSDPVKNIRIRLDPDRQHWSKDTDASKRRNRVIKI